MGRRPRRRRERAGVKDIAPAVPARTYRILKRGLDIFGSLAGLLLLSPLLVGIAVAIKLTSRGPILFRQQRYGRSLQPFTLYKFRSMQANCDDSIHRAFVTRWMAAEGSPGVNKIARDPRVTAVGGWLRRTSLDELPQLWNVLRGEMSLVGPRPCLRYELDQYQDWHRLRLLNVTPGMTGLWQVSGRSMVGFEEMVKLDLAYARQRSLWLDLKILLKTPGVVISGFGAF